jgi:ribosomal protein S9
MSASGYIIVVLVLAIAIAGAIGYLLLANRKRGRSLMGEKPEIQKCESTKPLAETETQPIEEAHKHEAVGEITQEAEEALSGSEVEGLPDTPEEIQRVMPPKRGGRTHRIEMEKSPTREGSPHHPKPETVCWEKGREWFLGIEVPEELCKSGEAEIMQDSLRLERDTSRTNCWCLTHAFGKLTVSTVEAPIVLGKEGESYLLFKLSGENRREGRLVTSPSSGEYLVVVPANWKITNQISVSSEQIDMESYQAYWHVFDSTDNIKMVFSTPKGDKSIHSKSPRFRMIGPSLNDASYMGPLFGENPPQIGAHDITDWNEVGTIIIGEIGESRWRSEVPLTLESAAQTLPPEVLERESGWYFLRFYDQHDDLMESLDFRFVRGLKKIKMPRPQPFPLEAGHELACVEILHDPECTFESADTLSTDIHIERTDTGTALSVPPNPACDKTRWRISYGSGAKVEITILIERVRWNIETETETPSTWRDRFEPLLKEDFSATSNKVLWLRFPAQRWVKKITAGFQIEQARDYPVAVGEQTVCIPVREFEVRDLHRDHFFRVWLEHGGKQHEGIVAVVAGLRPDWVGYGRKQSAIAIAMMRKGVGKMEVNGFSITEYFQRAPSDANLYLQQLCGHDQIRDVLSQLDISFRVWGSSPNTKRQVKAVAHALAHVLIKYQPELTSTLQRFRGARVSRSACIGKEGLLDESD